MKYFHQLKEPVASAQPHSTLICWCPFACRGSPPHRPRRDSPSTPLPSKTSSGGSCPRSRAGSRAARPRTGPSATSRGLYRGTRRLGWLCWHWKWGCWWWGGAASPALRGLPQPCQEAAPLPLLRLPGEHQRLENWVFSFQPTYEHMQLLWGQENYFCPWLPIQWRHRRSLGSVTLSP